MNLMNNYYRLWNSFTSANIMIEMDEGISDKKYVWRKKDPVYWAEEWNNIALKSILNYGLFHIVDKIRWENLFKKEEENG